MVFVILFKRMSEDKNFWAEIRGCTWLSMSSFEFSTPNGSEWAFGVPCGGHNLQPSVHLRLWKGLLSRSLRLWSWSPGVCHCSLPLCHHISLCIWPQVKFSELLLYLFYWVRDPWPTCAWVGRLMGLHSPRTEEGRVGLRSTDGIQWGQKGHVPWLLLKRETNWKETWTGKGYGLNLIFLMKEIDFFFPKKKLSLFWKKQEQEVYFLSRETFGSSVSVFSWRGRRKLEVL